VSRLSFRQRIALLTALAIALTVAAASAAVWVIAKHELYDQIDSTLEVQVGLALNDGHGFFGGGNGWTEIVRGDGATPGGIPVTKTILAVAQGKSTSFFTSSVIQTQGGPTTFREFAFPIPSGGAVVAIQPLDPTLHALSRIRFWILLIGGLGVLLAAALAAGVATLALRPVRTLTAAAETVAATSWGGSQPGSTRCSRRSRSRWAASGASSPTRRTSCARR
jgi:two-component system sensor histidine kinase MprB